MIHNFIIGQVLAVDWVAIVFLTIGDFVRMSSKLLLSLRNEMLPTKRFHCCLIAWVVCVSGFYLVYDLECVKTIHKQVFCNFLPKCVFFVVFFRACIIYFAVRYVGGKLEVDDLGMRTREPAESVRQEEEEQRLRDWMQGWIDG